MPETPKEVPSPIKTVGKLAHHGSALITILAISAFFTQKFHDCTKAVFNVDFSPPEPLIKDGEKIYRNGQTVNLQSSNLTVSDNAVILQNETDLPVIAEKCGYISYQLNRLTGAPLSEINFKRGTYEGETTMVEPESGFPIGFFVLSPSPEERKQSDMFRVSVSCDGQKQSFIMQTDPLKALPPDDIILSAADLTQEQKEQMARVVSLVSGPSFNIPSVPIIVLDRFSNPGFAGKIITVLDYYVLLNLDSLRDAGEVLPYYYLVKFALHYCVQNDKNITAFSARLGQQGAYFKTYAPHFKNGMSFEYDHVFDLLDLGYFLNKNGQRSFDNTESDAASFSASVLTILRYFPQDLMKEIDDLSSQEADFLTNTIFLVLNAYMIQMKAENAQQRRELLLEQIPEIEEIAKKLCLSINYEIQ